MHVANAGWPPLCARGQERAAPPRAEPAALTRHGLLEAGRNCDSIRHADRFALLIDAQAYFSALREALTKAQRTIFIVGWDINSRMKLVPEGADDGWPEPLGEFLQALAAARRRLRIYILAWDFAMIYAFEREWLPVYQTGWRAHHGVLFRLDGTHPRGASHHQKFVVIDDRLAFVGGLDLTRSRWDTPAHAPDDARRRDPNGTAYGPFHDVQTMFDGDAARAIGELARARWQASCGRRIAIRAQRSLDDSADPWPSEARIDLPDVLLGISLTAPPYRSRMPTQQVRALTADFIAAAQRSIYIENQYFTAAVVREALCERLAEPDGPNVAVIVPRMQSGWLQEATMGVLRARLHRALVDADRHDRYRMYCPHIDGLGSGCLNIHSKVMIVDDTLMTVGSANLNNRSMVLDTECNIAIDSNGDARVRAVIAEWRNRLLAEHLDVPVDDIVAKQQRHGGLNATIAALGRDEGRSLRPFTPVTTSDLDALVPVNAWLDPEQPIAPQALVREFVPEEHGKSLTARFLLLGALVLGVVVLTVLWRFTALGQHINLALLVHWGKQLGTLPFSPLIVLAGYVVAAVLSVPITALIAATGLVFGAWPGMGYAFFGTVIAAATTYGIGVSLGRDAVRRLAGARANRLSERIGQRGIVTMMVLRLLPIAPFTIVNLVAGASHISLRDYLIGTVLGMTPGIVLTVTFAHQLIAAIRHPGGGAWATLIAIGVALVGVSVMLQRWLGKRQ
ncbi:VTT domain-containing protein [Trinickia sp. LjRoot230]|uniref:VTT domain-containing protein n=1 Tax=Trinickia sp. LjRoot230 TaxID=3342288 RepID=UPI003F4FBCC4